MSTRYLYWLNRKAEKFAMRAVMASLVIGSLVLSAELARGQEPNPTTVAPGAKSADVITKGENGVYIYHVKVVQRELDAVNYLNRSGSTHVGFVGTELMPAAKGDGKVDSQTGKTHISVHFDGLTPANGFGPEYLTYVLWAISADGRPQNLGELELAGNKANLDVTCAFQSFGMIVTAEPYFAVSQPSDVVVLKNVFTDRTQGVLQTVNVHYQLLPRGLFANTDGAHSVWHPVSDRGQIPLALYEAHNAVRIAAMAGADKYAADIMQEAKTDLKNADDIQSNPHRDVKMEFTQAREAVQRAEDARLTTLRKQASEHLQQTEEAKNAAQSDAARSREQAEQSQMMAANARAEADQAAAAKAAADAERNRAMEEAAKAKADAAAANVDAASAKEEAAKARERLRAQLSAIMTTNETARGLIVSMPDVLFDTAQYSLKNEAQVNLARVAGILEAYPGLKVQVEGYTDSVGSDDYNQKLSENRAGSVRDFLMKEGVSINNLSAEGFGKNDPVADNGTSQGRAQNRRVELVVTGDAIGISQQAEPEGGRAVPSNQ